MSQTPASFAVGGGLDLMTPALRMQPGRAIACVNYEPDLRGYSRVTGYERLDGRPKPSQASYWTLSFDQGATQIMEGDTVTGGTSGATGIALYDAEAATGSYGGGDAAGTIILTQVTGTFQDDEDLEVSASPVAVADGTATSRGADDDSDDTTWLRAAIDYARAQIAAVPGSGPVRGVWSYMGSKYAVRDNSGGTAGVLHKATTSGWQAQDLGREVAFTSGGTYEVLEGDIITGATSAATAIVRRVILTSGTWAGGDAAGRLIVNTQTGTFQSENLDVGANTNVATIAGDTAAITLPAGGRYEFVNTNFYGASNLRRCYFVNGVGKAHEYDGVVAVPINTGMPNDTPNHLAAYKLHLFLSFPGGSLQNSATGNPQSWNAVLGAAEIGLGEDITGLIGDSDTALIVLGRNKVSYLTGDDQNNFFLDTIADDAGAIEWSAQRVQQPVFFDDIGLRDLTATDKFGDWRMGSKTFLVEPLIRAKRQAGVTVKASLRVRARDQYRLFWSDGTGITVYMGRKDPETLPFDLGMVVECCCSAEEADGTEVLLIGDSDGMVYQLDSGNDFDGEDVDAYIRLAFNSVGSQQRQKRWHKATLEVDASATTTLGMTAEYGYADPDQPPSPEQSFSVRGGGGFWNESLWDQFYWSSPAVGLAEAPIDGLGRNISITVISSAAYEDRHTITGLTLNYTNRKVLR